MYCGVPVKTPVRVSAGFRSSKCAGQSATRTRALPVQEDVRRLDVAVRDATAVRMIDPRRDLLKFLTASVSCNRPLRAASRGSLEASRMLIHGIPSSIPLAKMGTMFGWSSAAPASCSSARRMIRHAEFRRQHLGAIARSSRASCAAYRRHSALAEKRMIVNGPTMDPAASVAMNGSSPASSSEARC
jgi:hypothetical protein